MALLLFIDYQMLMCINCFHLCLRKSFGQYSLWLLHKKTLVFTRYQTEKIILLILSILVSDCFTKTLEWILISNYVDRLMSFLKNSGQFNHLENFICQFLFRHGFLVSVLHQECHQLRRNLLCSLLVGVWYQPSCMIILHHRCRPYCHQIGQILYLNSPLSTYSCRFAVSHSCLFYPLQSHIFVLHRQYRGLNNWRYYLSHSRDVFLFKSFTRIDYFLLVQEAIAKRSCFYLVKGSRLRVEAYLSEKPVLLKHPLSYVGELFHFDYPQFAIYLL